ncbi:hypothetical protein [Streptomyces sp. AP-93]|uniref:hypothetical protein n=1 Tax=Streptomyces sp. AP-93 TaxID=2929048 RepID=UPI001FAEBD8A|nr:hypothetical protein [Streptomyces sp. AP-93]MCJ0869662.1 hypothetical protein [Streptomyces sp. AP-93]
MTDAEWAVVRPLPGWRDHALIKEFHDRLRARILEREERDAELTAGVIDSQSVKAMPSSAPTAAASAAAS